MAAQGNPKLYARQKAKHLTLILLASLLLSVYVRAEVVLYCHEELSIGILPGKQTGPWRTDSFTLERFTIKFNDDYTSLTGLFLDHSFPCAPAASYLPGRIVCPARQHGSTFIYNQATRRFLYFNAEVPSYTENGVVHEVKSVTTLNAGTCQKF